MLEKLIVMVEELSMETALESLLPRCWVKLTFRLFAFNAKTTC